MSSAATAAGVAYVPGAAFYVGDDRRHEMRLSFSNLSEPDFDVAIERLGGVIRQAAS